MNDVLLSLIAIIPTTTTVVVGAIQNRSSVRRSSRNAITGLIIEDHVRVAEGKAPENEQAIHEEFDVYKRAGGNSYIQGKVENYDRWHSQLKVIKKEGVKDAKS